MPSRNGPKPSKEAHCLSLSIFKRGRVATECVLATKPFPETLMNDSWSRIASLSVSLSLWFSLRAGVFVFLLNVSLPIAFCLCLLCLLFSLAIESTASAEGSGCRHICFSYIFFFFTPYRMLLAVSLFIFTL